MPTLFEADAQAEQSVSVEDTMSCNRTRRLSVTVTVSSHSRGPAVIGQSSLPKRTDFERILVESLDEVSLAKVDVIASPELERHLRSFLALPYDRMNTVELLFSSLERAYDLLGTDVLRLVVRKMYAKADVHFYEVAGTPMFQYVYELKQKLTNYGLEGKPPRRENNSQLPKPRKVQLVPTKVNPQSNARSSQRIVSPTSEDDF